MVDIERLGAVLRTGADEGAENERVGALRIGAGDIERLGAPQDGETSRDGALRIGAGARAPDKSRDGAPWWTAAPPRDGPAPRAGPPGEGAGWRTGPATAPRLG